MSVQPLTEKLRAEERRYTEKYGLIALTPCYAATYDHKTGRLGKRTYLWMTRRDNHNAPVISVDSKGYLHVIIGAHTANFFYMRSLKPNSTTDGWTKPEPIGSVWWKPGRKPSGGYGVGYTYTGLMCDQQDNLHLVARLTKSKFYLVYFRKKAGQPWEPFRVLVNPFRHGYCAWRQKINIDRLGRLFVNYAYFGALLRQEEVDAYKKKFPEHKVSEQRTSGLQPGIRPIGPSVLISEDQGDTWRLALTEDFEQGIKLMRANR